MVCSMLIKQFEADGVNWSKWSYGKIPKERKLAAWKKIRHFAEMSSISTYRCTDYWLEDALLKKFYRRVTRPKEKEVLYHRCVFWFLQLNFFCLKGTSNNEAVNNSATTSTALTSTTAQSSSNQPQEIDDDDQVELVEDPFGILPLVQYPSDDDAGESSSRTSPTKRRYLLR